MRRSGWIGRKRADPVEKALDDLCRAVTWARDGGRCVRRWCRATQYTSVLDWAHVHTRGIKSLRWEMDNVMLLCKRCHMIWHGQIVVAGIDSGRTAWWTAQYPERERRLNLMLATHRQQFRRRPPIDKVLIGVHLRAEYKRLTGRTWEGAA